jgi:hypothetical protein
MEEIVALIDAADEPKKHGPYSARQPAEISKLSHYLAVSSHCNLGKFRHSGRQLEHVVHNQRSSVFLQASPPIMGRLDGGRGRFSSDERLPDRSRDHEESAAWLPPSR